MKHLSIDIETYSSVNLQSAGLYRYAAADDFAILLFAYSADYGPARVVDLASGEHLSPELIDALADPAVIKHAYNAAFEQCCLSKFTPTPIEQWRCTMLHGMYCGYPAGLAAAVTAAGLPQDKRKSSAGAALIRLFCIPQKPTKTNGERTRTLPQHEPEKWALFKEYCRQDVAAEMALDQHLSPWPVPEQVQKEWETDHGIVSRGIRVDRELVDGALWCDQVVSDRLTAEAVKISGIENPNSRKQLLAWLQDESEIAIENLRKETVAVALPCLEDGAAKRMLEIRQELALASVKKYAAMAEVAGSDDRARGTLMFYGGSRTGRWSGRLVQLQNLTKHNLNNDLLLVARRLVKQRNLAGIEALFGSAPDILSQLVRTAFIPSDGNRLIIADYSAIEARVIAWLAGEAWRQEVFRTHGKIYEASAAAMFGVPIETIVKGHDNYALRQRGKVAELGLGYGMGASKFKNEAEKKYKVDFTDEEAQDIVRRWRDASPKIEDFWVESEEAALVAMRSGYPVTLKNGIAFQHKTDTAGQHFLTIQLPSGRELFYAQPEIGTNRWGRPQVGYYEKAGNRAGTWVKQETYGGKLVENITQAVARDCLALAIERAVKAGFHPVMHVHDEIICDDAPGGVDALCALMAEPIPWAPSLILRAEGFEAEFYKKE